MIFDAVIENDTTVVFQCALHDYDDSTIYGCRCFLRWRDAPSAEGEPPKDRIPYLLTDLQSEDHSPIPPWVQRLLAHLSKQIIAMLIEERAPTNLRRWLSAELEAEILKEQAAEVEV